jgi:nucleoside-diphosphate-sugar epimerase
MKANTTIMKVIVTGSLGNISKPLAKELVQKGHTVISSKPEKQKDIEALGAWTSFGHGFNLHSRKSFVCPTY